MWDFASHWATSKVIARPQIQGVAATLGQLFCIDWPFAAIQDKLLTLTYSFYRKAEKNTSIDESVPSRMRLILFLFSSSVPQGSWSRCHHLGGWPSDAEQRRTWSLSDVAHCHTDCSWHGVSVVTALCAPWPGHTQLPGRKWPPGEDRRLRHVQGHLQHGLLSGVYQFHSCF